MNINKNGCILKKLLHESESHENLLFFILPNDGNKKNVIKANGNGKSRTNKNTHSFISRKMFQRERKK